MQNKLAEFLRKYAWTVAAGVAVIGTGLFVVATCIQKRDTVEAEPAREPLTMYDIPYEQYELVEGHVERNETMGKILERFGIGTGGTHRITQAGIRDGVDITKIRADQPYVAMLAPDTLSTDTIARPRLVHFVYESSQTEYFVVSLPGIQAAGGGDSIIVRKGEKPVRIERNHASATIESSMWNAIAGNGLPLALAVELEEIFGWSVDFFGIQEGDSFDVIYDQRYVDTVKMNGVGRIWGAVFHHAGKELYAIPFKQDDRIAYWDENGNSLKKQFLRAPLNYSRISSRFSNARRHPITRIVRPHHAVDYAAPVGTPVRAVADGVVTRRYWERGGGNTVWIKHARGYETGYLHLSKFGNIAVGKRVSQGQTIGYVGSTGQSTGPHLDYRIKVNGRPIDPLKIPQEPGLPIKEANREAFSFVRSRIMAELAGTLPVEERLLQLDSIAVPAGVQLEPVNPSPVDTTRNVIDGVK
ncbi:MAG: M23 family metallopeptidase [Alistipes sp.]|jgi:murein DD-endopeptidase MepM/ murein hydrolase activator NlpD|nr:M23 family metallopeptidase [Alistipes sp.]